MILVIDNYDSFTFNLVHLLRLSAGAVRVLRNDDPRWVTMVEEGPEAVVISPGPGNPGEAGISSEVIRRVAGRYPVLGVCLGHQVLAEVFGGQVVPYAPPMHGKTSLVEHRGRGVLRGLPDPMRVMRYHSLGVQRDTLPSFLEVTAWVLDRQDQVMGLRHKEWPLEGVQFHPESFMTPDGEALIRNFVRGIREGTRS